MEKPSEPKKEDCCNSGCNPCIFDIYEQKLKQYEKYLERGETIDVSLSENGILQLEYTKFVVLNNVNLCDSHNLITFKRQTPKSNRVWWKPGDHFLFKFISSESSCTRAYTPITLKNKTRDSYDFAIAIKKYDNGVVSSHLYDLKEGSETLWRGPYGHYEMKNNTFDRIIMIAQGTGIAPFITIIDSILNNDDDMTKIILLYCCKCMDTILFREDLYSFKSYWNFMYQIHLSTTTSNTKIKYQEPINDRKLDCADICSLKPLANDQFLICGSPQFNEYYDVFIKKEIPLIQNIVLF